MSQASKKGAIFDDCLRFAKLWAEKQTSKTELKQKKTTKKTTQPGLF